MADDDNELFQSALTEPATEAAPPEQEQPDGPPRDEHGRFAPKAKEEPREEPAPQEQPPEQPEKPATDGIPSWRLREEAEARRAAEERAARAEQEAAEFRRRMAQFEQSKQPVQVPDIFENPSAFVDHGVKSAVDPIKQEITQLREFYSRREAIRAHGAEKVNAAYDALGQGLRSGNPEAHAVYQRAMQSFDPFGDIVDWHQRHTVFSQVGSDPNAWFEKQLEERLKDPTHQAKLMDRIRGQVQPPQRPVTQLPPSLNKATSAAPSGDDGDDLSDGGLLKSALRR